MAWVYRLHSQGDTDQVLSQTIQQAAQKLKRKTALTKNEMTNHWHKNPLPLKFNFLS